MLKLNQSEKGLPAEMRNQCVNALYLLCKISRSRQEEAAINGVLPPLQVPNIINIFRLFYMSL